MAEHSLYLEDRKYLEMVGVTSVITFDEEEIILQTNMGYLNITGENLHITMLNLEQNKVAIQGTVSIMEYKAQGTDLKSKGKNILTRLLK
ncbi:hypothetical protein SYNTR_1931 [Candidatus Syntrophocurvum alkaliphilum]|uniref:Forespore shell protein n=1 Tax=Candidatus Syntrophocurvum alkaliphilum TaxID=2293317 RepID=A0A6I6DD13_9FIRM|nr:sporulation protein YabP [Candidatus Syntrophocurvum alkaliphilum]QGU00525.1 hypothetical protein SYNTR_1931 [Candidatus Syntrophocurvum alkaliphilum]